MDGAGGRRDLDAGVAVVPAAVTALEPRQPGGVPGSGCANHVSPSSCSMNPSDSRGERAWARIVPTSGQAAACHCQKLRLERLQALGQAFLVTLLPDRLIEGTGVGGRRWVKARGTQQLDALLCYAKTVHRRPGRPIPAITDLPLGRPRMRHALSLQRAPDERQHGPDLLGTSLLRQRGRPPLFFSPVSHPLGCALGQIRQRTTYSHADHRNHWGPHVSCHGRLLPVPAHRPLPILRDRLHGPDTKPSQYPLPLHAPARPRAQSASAADPTRSRQHGLRTAVGSSTRTRAPPRTPCGPQLRRLRRLRPRLPRPRDGEPLPRLPDSRGSRLKLAARPTCGPPSLHLHTHPGRGTRHQREPASATHPARRRRSRTSP
ncbi:hypothetical protein SUDANB140_04631 [Streptomyces sp. enrichment culture]